MSIKFTSTGIEFTNNIDQYIATAVTTVTTAITMNSKRFRLTADYTSPNSALSSNSTHSIIVTNNKVQLYDTIVPNVLSDHSALIVTVSNIVNNEFTINIINNGADITNNVELSFLVLT